MMQKYKDITRAVGSKNVVVRLIDYNNEDY